MRKYSFSKEEKLEILNFYENSQFTLNEVAELYKVDSRTIKDWQNRYISFYNSERYQEKLDGLSPLEFRDQAA
ncbi:helix-turn-helix domain-containing protein [Peribacillus simplex]|uniref:helix-turn-helix domain-containing protein n=1 Tax=Peribacillus simplex TaxID=1478 RepID=UPI00298E4B9A|nr:helix-turn-helix domain-containing protein [Peribacillus simplex]MDW7615818.1 helix-turn-helix domain-containing protein [Peribacillus simplex]